MQKKDNTEAIMTVRERLRANRRTIIKTVIIFAVVISAILLFFHIVKFPRVSGDSMAPLYRDGERLVAIASNDVELGDVVVIWDSTLDDEGGYIVKRIVGVGGDHIEVKNGTLYRNGTAVYEGYINETAWGAEDFLDVTVPENDVFVLGDNRNHSLDSRKIGTVPIDNIKMRIISKFDIIEIFKSL